MKPKLDSYTIQARFFPGIITSLPIIILWFFLINKYEVLSNLSHYVFGIKLFGPIAISFIFVYAFSLVIRDFAKRFEKKYFINNKGFPTTYFMTFRNNEYSKSYKNRFREKVLSSFNIRLFNENEEYENPLEMKRMLDETIKLIINRVGSGKLVLKHNIWYGFIRNLIGGSVVGTILSIINITIGYFVLHNSTLIYISLVLLLVFLSVFFWRRFLLIQNAEAYARQLISEFMSVK